MLREQAAVLLTLAGSFDIQTIRDELLDIATLCEEIAKLADSPVQWLHADTGTSASVFESVVYKRASRSPTWPNILASVSRFYRAMKQVALASLRVRSIGSLGG